MSLKTTSSTTGIAASESSIASSSVMKVERNCFLPAISCSFAASGSAPAIAIC